MAVRSRMILLRRPVRPVVWQFASPSASPCADGGLPDRPKECPAKAATNAPPFGVRRVDWAALLSGTLIAPVRFYRSKQTTGGALAPLRALYRSAPVYVKRQLRHVVRIGVIDQVHHRSDLAAVMVRRRDRAETTAEDESGHDAVPRNSAAFEEAMIKDHRTRESKVRRKDIILFLRDGFVWIFQPVKLRILPGQLNGKFAD